MSNLNRLVLAILLAALGPAGRMAHAQTAPMTYWAPGWFGLGGNLDGQSGETYGNFPGFTGSDAGGGFGVSRYNFQNGWFVGSERFGMGLTNQVGAFGNSVSYDGVQFGYNFQKSNGLPVTVYAGFDTLKYNTGIGSNPFAPFDSMSGTMPGYSAHAGVEIQPTSNLSLSLGFGYTQQQSGRISESSQQPGRISNDPFSAAYLPVGR